MIRFVTLNDETCGVAYWNEHGEELVCTLALKDHLEGMDEPHQFGATEPTG